MKIKPSFYAVLAFILVAGANSYAQSNATSASENLSREEIKIVYDSAQANMHKNPELAAKGYQQVVDWMEQQPGNDTTLIDYYRMQANSYRVLGSYAGMDNRGVEALELQEKSLNIKRRLGDRESQIQNFKAISSLWGNQGDFEKAGIAADSAYRIAKETNSAKYLSEAARGKAAFYMATEVLDSADYYFKLAIKTSDMSPNKVPKYASLDMYGRFLREQGKIKESLPYVNQFLDAVQQNNDTIFYAATYLTLGESQLALGNPQQAIVNFEKGAYYAEKTNQRDDLDQFYRGLADSYEATNNFKKALEAKQLHFDAYVQKRDTSAYRDRAEVALRNKYALQKAVDSTAFAQQKLIDESELKRKANTRFWAVLLGLLAVLGIGGFLFWRNRQKVKEQAYQNILLNNKIATKTEEINELLTETMQHIKSKQRIAANLQKLSKSEEGITLKSIIADINASKADDAKLMVIKQNIEQVNYDFIKALKSTHPQLSKTDIEVCSFIRIGLDRNEIATLRNTSVEAVRKSRHRLRKKMELSDEIDLKEYLVQQTTLPDTVS